MPHTVPIEKEEPAKAGHSALGAITMMHFHPKGETPAARASALAALIRQFYRG